MSTDDKYEHHAMYIVEGATLNALLAAEEWLYRHGGDDSRDIANMINCRRTGSFEPIRYTEAAEAFQKAEAELAEARREFNAALERGEL